ncbi:MAG: hypothetical protein OQK25_01540 [Gammaproteobacteria bacterium]|nr:hypothetical protein [Gammaproteobacteria bacterium]
MTENRESVSSCIDDICQLGCDGVRSTISAIENGEKPELVSSLNSDDRASVLVELKEIMAVYDAESEQK